MIFRGVVLMEEKTGEKDDKALVTAGSVGRTREWALVRAGRNPGIEATELGS